MDPTMRQQFVGYDERVEGSELTHDSRILSSLMVKRESLNVILRKTQTNLGHFVEQCRMNPSTEVEGLARFHQDRVMQIQVELKSLRQSFKEMQRARLCPLRSHMKKPKKLPEVSIIDLLDPAVYTIIFPLVAASDGEKARLLPQVCKAWNTTFGTTKCYWTNFTVTRPICDCSRLTHILHNATNLSHLQLLFDDSHPALSPQSILQLLAEQTRLRSLTLVSPGAILRHAVRGLPTGIQDLRLESTPDLDVQCVERIARQLPHLSSLQVTDAPAFNDEALSALAVSARPPGPNTITNLTVTGCRNLRGTCMRNLARNCKSLRSIHIARCPVSALALEPMAELDSLKQIAMISCTRTDASPAIDFVCSCKGLESVVLFDIGPLYNEGISNIVSAQPRLTKLILGPCTSITEEAFASSLAGLPQLTHLSVTGCHLLSDSTLSSIAELLPNLEQLLLTEANGFSDAGIFAMEDCTKLTHLTLHPMTHVSSAGLRVLCDYCDALQYLCLANCPAAKKNTIISMITCCLNLKVLILTHIPSLSESDLEAIMSTSCILNCLALVPKTLTDNDGKSIVITGEGETTADPANGAGAVYGTAETVAGAAQRVNGTGRAAGGACAKSCVHVEGSARAKAAARVDFGGGGSSGGIESDGDGCDVDDDAGGSGGDIIDAKQAPVTSAGLERLMERYPDAVVFTEWGQLDKLFDMCIPTLEQYPDIRHSVLGDLFVGGRPTGSLCADDFTMARRVVRVLFKCTGLLDRDKVSREKYLRDVRLLREALVVEMGSDEMRDHTRILLEMDAVLETYEQHGRGAGGAAAALNHAYNHFNHAAHLDFATANQDPAHAGAAPQPVAHNGAGGVAHNDAWPASGENFDNFLEDPVAALMEEMEEAGLEFAEEDVDDFGVQGSIGGDVGEGGTHGEGGALDVMVIEEQVEDEGGQPADAHVAENEMLPGWFDLLPENADGQGGDTDDGSGAGQGGQAPVNILHGGQAGVPNFLGAWEMQAGAAFRARDTARGLQGDKGQRQGSAETRPGPDTSILRLLRICPYLASARILLHSKCHCAGECSLANSIVSTFRRLDRQRPTLPGVGEVAGGL